jgi:hypothetical protein
MCVDKEYRNRLFNMSKTDLNKEWDDVMSMIRKKLNKKEKVEKIKFVRRVSSGITYM